MSRTLLVTNDFPPRPGGIQSVRARPRGPPAGRLGRGLRLDAGAAPRSSTPTSPSRWSASRPGCCCPPRASPAGPPSSPARTTATPSGSAPPRRWGCSPPGCAAGPGSRRAVALTHGHEVGWAALPGARTAAAPHRPGRRRRDLPGRVHPRPAGPGAGRPHRAAAAGPGRGRRRLPPGGRRRPRSAPATACPTGRWWSASPGWCRARARTR